MTRFIIEILAYVLMTIDHIGMFFTRVGEPLNLVLRITGRGAFILFAFMIGDGFRHTKNENKYLLRIGIMGFLIELGYLLSSLIMDVPEKPFLNVYLSLFIGLLALILFKKKGWYKLLGIIPIAYVFITKIFELQIPFYRTAIGLTPEYNIYGLSLILIFGLVPNKLLSFILTILSTFTFCNPGLFSLLGVNSLVLNSQYEFVGLYSFLFIFLYNGEKGLSIPRFIKYTYYPFHLAVLYIIFYLIYL